MLLEENFESISLARNGWYDLPDGMLTGFTFKERAPGSTRSLQAHFRKGDTNPFPRVGGRRLFRESESVYLRFWVKYSDNWVGSGQKYHPHEFLILTNADSAFQGPSYTHLTAYVEHNFQNGGYAQIGIQDGKNVDLLRVGTDLTAISERRAVAGCNGDPPGERGQCFPAEGVYRNTRMWRSAIPAFLAPRLGTHSTWHKVEAYFRLNSIRGGKGIPDGVAQYWIDDRLLIDRRDVLFRTGAFPNLKFRQLMLAPYIGDGSPVDQTAWYDDILVMNERPGGEAGSGKREG